MKRRSVLGVCVILMALTGGVSGVGAYTTYEAEAGGGNCSSSTCHPGFLGGPDAPLHDAHIALSNDCSLCHVVPGDNPMIGLDASQTTGCAGCHGRLEDGLPEIGAGLRLHHANAGETSCEVCHTTDPAVPVGEDVFPPFFSAVGLDPCTDNLDDDGDTMVDGADPDCAQSECTVDSDCDDGIACTVDTCNEFNQCANTPDNASCDDENFCTTDTCDAVAGCVFTPVECPPGEQCDPADGACKGLPGCTVDEDCDDELFCNGAETCDVDTGTCLQGTPVDCDDGIDCTVDTCDEENDACANTPDDAACPDDGLFCNGDEVCDPAAGCVSTGDPCPEGTTCNECTDTCCAPEAKKVTICHKGKNTITVGAPAVPAHLAHGDTLGPCEGDPWPDDDDDCGPCDQDDNGKPCDHDDDCDLSDGNDDGDLSGGNNADQATMGGCGTTFSVPEDPKAVNLGCLVMVFGALVLWKRSGRRR